MQHPPSVVNKKRDKGDSPNVTKGTVPIVTFSRENVTSGTVPVVTPLPAFAGTTCHALPHRWHGAYFTTILIVTFCVFLLWFVSPLEVTATVRV